MSFDTLVAQTRQAFADDAAKAEVVLSAQGTLVGVTEVDVRTGAHSFRADEPRSISHRRPTGHHSRSTRWRRRTWKTISSSAIGR